MNPLLIIGLTPAPLGATVGVIDGRLTIAILWALVSLGMGILVRMAVEARRRSRNGSGPRVVPTTDQGTPRPAAARRAA